ncbi:hypothetical protein TNCV_3716801 [Trichonephila clavipes]|nr:hypothetical protein TNCV_3716801 [Trichonephila clavipes]
MDEHPRRTAHKFTEVQVACRRATKYVCVVTTSRYTNSLRMFHGKEIQRGGFVGHRSRASSKHLSPHLPVGSLDSSGSNRGCAAPEAARVGVGSTKKPTPDVVVFEK